MSDGGFSMRHLFLVGTLICLMGCTGSSETSAETSANIDTHENIKSNTHLSTKLNLSELEKDPAAVRQRLACPYHKFASQLGAHKFVGKSVMEVQLRNHHPRKIEQTVELLWDAKGHFAANKVTSPQYGNEVIWTGDWLYPRLRFSKFIKRKARPKEPSEIADRMYSLWPAYWQLLRRFLNIKPEGNENYLGRNAIRIVFSLKTSPTPVEDEASSAKQWRKHIVVKALDGKAILDADTSAPLSIDLHARWNFNPPIVSSSPPANGIPTKIDNATTGTMELMFSHHITDIGKVALISPPASNEIIDNPRRLRLEIERQILTGERPLNEIPIGDGNL